MRRLGQRGPTGVIASTMTDAFITAEAIARDWKERQSSGEEIVDKRFIGSDQSRGFEGVKELAERDKIDLRPVRWEDWEKIDAVERQRGKENGGKPREKLTSVDEMLRALD